MTEFLHGVEVKTILDGARTISTARFGVAGLIGTAPSADAAKFPLNTPVRVLSAKEADAITDGTLKDALKGFYENGGGVAVVVRVEAGADEAATLANVAGDAAAMTGVYAFMASESTVQLTPRILVAAGHTHQRPGGNANPVVAALKAVAPKLRAVSIVDGPNTSDADAITAATEAGSARIMLVDPWVKVFDAATATTQIEPSSARVAGLMVRVDNDHGFWFSPSNHELRGITGLARPIVHNRSDSDAQSNLLNAGNVTTIIHSNGFRLWGNRGTGQEPLTRYMSVQRTMDRVAQSVEQAFDWASDKPITSRLIIDVVETVSAYLRELRAQGAILGGRVWLDEELNTADTLKAGKAYINFDIEPPAPLERLTFQMFRNDTYYEVLIDQVQASVNAA